MVSFIQHSKVSKIEIGNRSVFWTCLVYDKLVYVWFQTIQGTITTFLRFSFCKVEFLVRREYMEK